MFKNGKGVNRNDFLAYALAEFVGGDEGVALKEELLPGMSNKEISFAKHLSIGFWHHGNISKTLSMYQTQIESQLS
jgi:hypothetical protein